MQVFAENILHKINAGNMGIPALVLFVVGDFFNETIIIR
jgi:hypothetical protein